MGQTFEQYLRAKLEENGLHTEMVDKLIPIIKEHDALSNMVGRWNNQVEGYPFAIAAMTFMAAKPIVAEWLKVNHPHAWFRPAFAPGAGQCRTPEEADAFVTKFEDENPEFRG